MTDDCEFLDLSEEDILDAMRTLQGYVDITPGTFREVYALAYAAALKRIRGQQCAVNVMTSPVHCVRMRMDAADAAKFMAVYRISGAPVVDDAGNVVGVLSEKDFLRRLGLMRNTSLMTIIAAELDSSGLNAAALRGALVGDFMTVPPIVATPQTSLAEISELFTRHAINRIPVCDEAGRAVGIVTRSDVVCSLCGDGAA